ncbi:MAG TPA: molybdopterin converting factor subunit 1 [Polyangiaceae bacterium]|nr:molybdopterin converting factor subunit 1 [Polyangiaceae bacterium]
MPRPVTLLYFAAVREAAGTSEEQLELPDAVRTVGDLSPFIERRHPSLAGSLKSVRYAVDEVFAEPSTPLVAGAVIAVIPPVSGG